MSVYVRFCQFSFGDEQQIHLVVRFIIFLGAGNPALAAWVAFLEHWQEERRMQQIDYPPVQQALQRIRDLSADEETRRLAFVRERPCAMSAVNCAPPGRRVGKKAGKKRWQPW